MEPALAERMMRFVDTEPRSPDRRPSAERVSDFQEIYRPFAAEKAAAQAARCAQCGVPFCQSACPLQNNIPDWLKLSAEGRLREAYELSAATNPMPEICGRICPQDRLCEGSCVIERSQHGAVTIGAVERYLTDMAWEQGWVSSVWPGPARGQSAGIIGAGPAGLAAAEVLRERGYDVVVYDRHDRIGGLMIYGIPNFKLDKSIVAKRAQRLIDGGVRFELNCEVGDAISFEELRRRHDAVLIATGVYAARQMAAPNSSFAAPALDFLIAANRVDLGDDVAAFSDGSLDAKGKRVVVIGGGDTAMDCVRTAVRQGADSVTCLYRRDRENMPGSLREVACAEEEGVRFEWLAQPKALRGGKAPAVKAVRMSLGAPDAQGRRAPEAVAGSDFELKADLVIAALGFDAEDIPARFRAPELAVRRSGVVRADPLTYETSVPGVFAAGDIVRGASLVVWALRDGRDAALAMHAWLEERANTARIAAE
jgi:glutamate synthase (NADPH/NADH) small chain